MTARVVQRGDRAVVLGFLIGEGADAALKAALPGCGIVTRVDAPHPTPADETAARTLVGARVDSPLILIGWSLGCRSIRDLLEKGVRPAVIVTLDGTASSWPISQQHVDLWRGIADDARKGKCVWVATCTLQRYVTGLKPPEGPFAPTSTVLARVLGVSEFETMPPSPHPLASYPGPAVIERHEGSLHVMAYGSTNCDKSAHSAQVNSVLGDVLTRYVAQAVDAMKGQCLPSTPVWNSDSPMVQINANPSTPNDLNAAILRIAEYDLSRAFTESWGHNDGPEIEELYLKPLGLKPGASYCAAGVSSWLRRAVASSGLSAPVSGTAGAQDFMARFKAVKLWTAKGPALKASLRPGHALVWDRSSPGGPSWLGHIGLVCSVGNEVCYTIECNADRIVSPDGKIYAVCMVERRLDDPKLLGAGRWA